MTRRDGRRGLVDVTIEGDEVVIDVRGREVAATVTKPPFVEVQVRQA